MPLVRPPRSLFPRQGFTPPRIDSSFTPANPAQDSHASANQGEFTVKATSAATPRARRVESGTAENITTENSKVENITEKSVVETLPSLGPVNQGPASTTWRSGNDLAISSGRHDHSSSRSAVKNSGDYVQSSSAKQAEPRNAANTSGKKQRDNADHDQDAQSEKVSFALDALEASSLRFIQALGKQAPLLQSQIPAVQSSVAQDSAVETLTPQPRVRQADAAWAARSMLPHLDTPLLKPQPISSTRAAAIAPSQEAAPVIEIGTVEVRFEDPAEQVAPRQVHPDATRRATGQPPQSFTRAARYPFGLRQG
jgi:hypothetical protein